MDLLLLDLDRGRDPLGIEVETGRESAGWDGKTVLIKRVKDGGAIHAWCRNHRRLVQGGDRIVSANGHANNAERILAECQKPLQALRLEIRPSSATRRPAVGAEHVEELREVFRGAASAAEAVQLVRKHRDHWHPSWGAEALLRIALRSTHKTKLAWAKDAAVLELAEWQGEVKLAKELLELESSLISLEGLKRLGFQLSLEHVAHVARLLTPQGHQMSSKSICRLLWLAAPWKHRSKDLFEVAGLLRVLRQRPAMDFDGLDLRMLFDAARRWSETTWLQEPQRLIPGKGLVKEVDLAEECLISFSVTIHEKVEGWSLLFTASQDRLPALYVSKDGVLAGSFAKTKEGLKEDLDRQSKETLEKGLPRMQVKQLALITLSLPCCTLSLDGQELPKIAAEMKTKTAAELLCKDSVGTQVAEASLGHLVHRPRRSCPGKDVPLLQKLLPRLRLSDGGSAHDRGAFAPLFPKDLAPAVELVHLAEDLAHLELRDEEALNSLGREILRRRPELKAEELQLAKGAFAMMKLSLPDVWSSVGVKMKKRGGDVVTQQAFAPMEDKVTPKSKRPRNKELEETSPPPSPPRR